LYPQGARRVKRFYNGVLMILKILRKSRCLPLFTLTLRSRGAKIPPLAMNPIPRRRPMLPCPG